MNCFEWQSRSSDYLDGSLGAPNKELADRHLETCTECSERHQHYRLILTSVASQPRVSLPPALRKAPLSAILPPGAETEEFEGVRTEKPTARSRWVRVPWLVRTTLEGTAIVLLILVGISAGPKLRKLYERHVEKSLGEFTESFSGEDAASAKPGEDAVPLARGKLPVTGDGGGNAEALAPAAGSDEFSGENEEENDDVASGDTSGDELRVGSSEIWRFNLKTDSPHEVRGRIVQMLTELHVASSTPGFGGVEAPGGIQFDLLVPKGVVLDLKRQLQKLSPKPAEGEPVPGTEGFTWYKNKSKHTLPEGRARVVIWLSQM